MFTSEWLVSRIAEELGLIKFLSLSTADIKRALTSVGRDELHLEVYPDEAPAGQERKGHREFLWDVSWWKEDASRAELILVVESEWGRVSDVCFDFEKLLVAKSPYKLLITDAGSQRQAISLFKGQIEECLKRHRDFRVGETYIWIDHAGRDGTGTGVLQAFEFKPQIDGPCHGPFFCPLGGGFFPFGREIPIIQPPDELNRLNP
jgi:hypothetical protein